MSIREHPEESDAWELRAGRTGLWCDAVSQLQCGQQRCLPVLPQVCLACHTWSLVKSHDLAGKELLLSFSEEGVDKEVPSA